MGCCQQQPRGNEHCGPGGGEGRRGGGTLLTHSHIPALHPRGSAWLWGHRGIHDLSWVLAQPFLREDCALQSCLSCHDQRPHYSSGSLWTSQHPLALHQLPFLSYLSLCTRQQETTGTRGCWGAGQDHDISAALGGSMYHNIWFLKYSYTVYISKFIIFIFYM